MFEFRRTELQAQLADVRQPVHAAQAELSARQAEVARQAARVTPAQAELAEAKGKSQTAQSQLVTAQALVAQREQDQATKQAARDAAVRAAIRHAAQEPKEVRGNPPVGWDAWKKEQDRLDTIAANAETQLAAATTALKQALPPRDAAAESARLAVGAVSAAQNALWAAEAALTLARTRVDAATAAVAVAEQHADQDTVRLTGQINALDDREARLLAAPLDDPTVRVDVQGALDAEIAELTGWRHERYGQYGIRACAHSDRAAALARQDAVADGVSELSAAIRGWPELGRYPTLPGVVNALDAVVASSRAQRALPAVDRTDDVRGAATSLSTHLGTLRAVLEQARAETAAAKSALVEAEQLLSEHQRRT